MIRYSLMLMLFGSCAVFGRCGEFTSAQTITAPQIDSTTFYRSTLAAAEKALRLNETSEAQYWLSQSPKTMVGWEWNFLSAQSDVSSQVFAWGEGEATGLDVSSDGKLVAIAFNDGAVSLFSLPDWTLVGQIAGHTDAVYSVEFSADGSRLVTVSRDTTSRVWDVNSKKEISHIKLDNPGVAAATFSPDGQRVATCTWLMVEEEGTRQVHGVVWVWDAHNGEVVHKTRVGVKPLDSIAWSADGDHLVVGSWDGYVHLLDKDTQEIGRFQVPDEGIYTAVIAVAISKDGKRIACGSKDRTARVWDIETGALVATLAGHGGFVNDVCFSSDGNELWTASVDGTLRQWNLENNRQLKVLRGHVGSVIELAMIPPETGDAGTSHPSLSNGSSEEIHTLAHNELCSVSLDGTLRRWSTDRVDKVNLRRRLDHDGTYTTVWSPDGSRIFVACYDGTVQVIDSNTGTPMQGWTAHEGDSCNTLSLSGDGRRLLTCSWDKTARLWDPQKHELLMELKLEGGCYDCSLSRDGKLAALAIGNNLEVWNLDTGERITSHQSASGQQLTEICFSPNGQRVAATGGKNAAEVWDLETQQLAGILPGEGAQASTVCWSPVGDLLATSGGEWVDIWQANTLKRVRRYRVGNRSARQLAFSPDGRRLFVAAEAITVMDPSRDGTLLRFQPCDDDIYYLSVAPDGQRLASCTTGGLISIAAAVRPEESPQLTPMGSETQSNESAWSFESSRILFSAIGDGQRNIYLFDRASEKTTQLTHETAKGQGANNPRQSPDGRQIVYQRVQPGNYDLALMSLAGNDASNFVEGPDYEVSPIWSPDGKRIAFMSTRGFELGSIGPFPGHIYSQDVASRKITQLTRKPLTSSLGPSDWSPDGKSLLMARDVGKRIRVFSLDIASGDERAVTDSPNNDYSATYSTDGERIAFHSETDQGANIVVCDVDGGNRQELTDDGFNYGPRWSPDNEWLIFTRSTDGKQYDIYAVNVVTKKMVSMIATDEDEREGNWLK